MYIYMTQAMPGCKARFDGDTSVKYQVRRRQTAASSRDKASTAVIRTDMGYTEATALVKIFNDKELESRAIRRRAASGLAQNA
ncbi:MAG TPA: hypothetical protein VGB98_09315 [Pyrinomonadaceae bacterium]|jgi:hypothetical protein